ncbi:AAA domain-containing protein [Roseimaritima sediminicola]|uniref:AAA domain-containing protein n=1 Tax=Roseimaritima sediminicola TaxID=2662066 RepID=UPI001298407E|nr:AAA domain-containing protein [Roseimaritima sediminicola]
MTSLESFLTERLAGEGFSTEDSLSSFLPLLEEVIETHAAGMVAPLDGLGALRVDGVRVWFPEDQRRSARDAAGRLRAIEAENRSGVEILSEHRRVVDVDEGTSQFSEALIGDPDGQLVRPLYLPGYQCWEHRIGHHDPRTDVFCLGMILASLACGLDFRDIQQLKRFVANRRNLFRLRGDLHPVVAQVIFQMTQLDRHRRLGQLEQLVPYLENYRDQSVSLDFDLAMLDQADASQADSKHVAVLSKLRQRLFQLSRRNRLLHFRPTLNSTNLTQASVPLSFDIQNIRPNQILIWNDAFKKTLVAGKAVSLNKYLNFSEALYLPAALDGILSETRKDQAEYGFAQLRLVIAFLRWSNLKEKPIQRFDSPLLLLPVRLHKKKGVRDTYYLQTLDQRAEVNPVIRYQFEQLFDIRLPESLDLGKTTVDAFYDSLCEQIHASEPAVTLSKVDRPRISLLHDKAKRKLDQYRRRARVSGRGVRNYLDQQYSYDPANYHPLGIKLFENKVRTEELTLQAILQRNPRPRQFAVPPPETPSTQREKTFFQLGGSDDESPYSWDFDLCNVTLANFKYRKMSLVRDYQTLLAQPRENPAFEATFSLTPRDQESRPAEAPPLTERHDVVACDPTQALAIAEARAENSYIIQGPPGTGKSQTITNLIADYVARGKRVLFVCEKRAALDVVYARLRQCGLDTLCCLVHDSQADKKALVMDLKRTYEGFLQDVDSGETHHSQHQRLLRLMDKDLQPLRHFDQAMRAESTDDGLHTRGLLDRCLVLRDRLPDLDALQRERLPEYDLWWQHREAIEAFSQEVAEALSDGDDAVFANHPLCWVTPRLADSPRPLETFVTHVEAALSQVVRLRETLDDVSQACGVSSRAWSNLDDVQAAAQYAAAVLPLARRDQLILLDADSDASKRFRQTQRLWEEQQQIVARAREMNRGWIQKLGPADTAVALEQAEAFQLRAAPWLSPAWWRLRRLLRHAYNFSGDAVRRSWTRILSDLQTEHQQVETLHQFAHDNKRRFHFEDDLDAFVDRVTEATRRVEALSEPLRQLHDRLRHQEQAAEHLQRLAELAPAADVVRDSLQAVCDCPMDRALETLQRTLATALEEKETLSAALRCVHLLQGVPRRLCELLTQWPLAPAELESAIADQSLRQRLQEDRGLQRFAAATRQRHVRQLGKRYEGWLTSNARHVVECVKQRFLEHVRIATTPAQKLQPEQKVFKKQYARGRRTLEHEFGKSMRYKPIRELITGDSGQVVRDLKPVWLMSPLSVSDTLPLPGQADDGPGDSPAGAGSGEEDLLDVVIFDEASQITLEEAVPALFRARQAIVVGDQMQLPPTSFFATKRDDDEADEALIEEDGQIIQYDLNSNSFLNHAATNLPSNMLGWHYRSRSESLISFSNWVFYDGRLLTVPEERLPRAGRPALEADAAEEARRHAGAVFDRSISFHWMRRGVYEKRRNRAEAEYIAELVREILSRDTGVSLGVIAFSEAQQSEIENALQRLAQSDETFAARLEAELEREVDNQFVGLLVKNLENIQGDERDVILLSVCYGPDPQGKMRMNFGPINQSGGEKRLNVAFSRAKQHMVVVSSIHGDRITNDYNDGANCLKNYLRYAAAVSVGDVAAARRVLENVSLGATPPQRTLKMPEVLADQLTEAITERGFVVDRDVGQSHFRCDLAVRSEGDTAYRLGILIDGHRYYQQRDIVERDLLRPQLLEAFGWRLTHVLAKDWYEDSAAVMNRIEGLLGS